MLTGIRFHPSFGTLVDACTICLSTCIHLQLFTIFVNLLFVFSSVMVFNAGEYAEFPDPAMRYLLCVNNGSFAFCSGSRKNIEFFLTRGNNLIYENHTAQNFAQL